MGLVRVPAFSSGRRRQSMPNRAQFIAFRPPIYCDSPVPTAKLWGFLPLHGGHVYNRIHVAHPVFTPMATQRRKYLFKAFINPDPLGFSQEHKPWVRGYIAARHKWDRRDESPYCVANESICAELGRFIDLPIPPYAITRTVSDEFSDRNLISFLDFNWEQRNLGRR